MSDNDTNSSLLIQYLDGELRGDAFYEVEDKLSKDPALQQELENLRNAQMVIKSYGLRQQVGSIHKEMMEELGTTETTKAPVRQMFSKVFRVAAIFIVILGFIAIYQYSSLSSGKLFEANYQSYVMNEARGESASSELERLYKQNLSRQVIEKFSEMKQPSQQDYFLAGNAYLKENEAVKAVESFKQLKQKNQQTNSHVLEDDGEYYLAMAYLRNDEPGNALPILEKIHNDSQHLYHDKVGSTLLLKVRLLTKK